MRKFLIAAVAALTAFAVVAVATAQTPESTGEVTLKPSKVAKKKKKRKSVELTLDVVNGDPSQTADRIQIYHAKQVKISTKGLKTCPPGVEDSLDVSACPSGSRLGDDGSASAIAGVNGAAPRSLEFDVTAYLLSKTKIGFLVDERGGDILTMAVGTFKSASGKYGKVLDVAIPPIARQIGNNCDNPPETNQCSFNGLKSLTATLEKKAGKNALYKLSGCPKSKKLPFRTVLSFQANPVPPKAETVTIDSTAKCSKAR